MLTVVMPSFYSSKLLEDRIAEINHDIPIIIIENSKDIQLKKKLENNFQNVKVIIPHENLGWGKAVNLGIKESKTQMVFISQPDVKLIDDCVNKLIDCTKNFKDFSLLAPLDLNNKDFTNYEIYESYQKINKNNKFRLEEVDYVDLSWLINKDNFDDDDLWDENIFLYFEALDFSKRLKKRNKKIFVAHNINTFHIGSSSHDAKFEYYSLLNRSWHYNWSRFYYQKKHFGYFYAFKKNISVLVKLFIKLFKNIISFNLKKQKLIFAEIGGLISSIICRQSSYRPYKEL